MRGKCDVAILKDEKLLRVEVKTGYRNYTGEKITHGTVRHNKFDILAVVIHKTNEIIYKPQIK
jgi:hypothetical protein